MAEPPRPGVSKGWTWHPGADTARYLIDPGDITGPGQGSPGNLRHRRPHIVSGSRIFVFPVGLEAFDVSGSALVGLHHYFGDNSVDARTLHYEEGRITLSGTFPGQTSFQNYVECRDILMSVPPDKGMTLYAEGAFGKEAFVIPENWRFSHEPTQQTDDSIDYSITFIRTGSGKPLPDPSGTPPAQNPTGKTGPKGKSPTFSVRAGARTFRQIAAVVYGNAERWTQLVDLNRSELSQLNEFQQTAIPPFQLPIHVWPIGTKFKY